MREKILSSDPSWPHFSLLHSFGFHGNACGFFPVLLFKRWSSFFLQRCCLNPQLQCRLSNFACNWLPNVWCAAVVKQTNYLNVETDLLIRWSSTTAISCHENMLSFNSYVSSPCWRSDCSFSAKKIPAFIFRNCELYASARLMNVIFHIIMRVNGSGHRTALVCKLLTHALPHSILSVMQLRASCALFLLYIS